jgi:hypothetical protein
MGMYSTFEEQDLDVINVEGLKKLRDDKNLELYGLIDEDGNVHFTEWDGNKLEGYWYKETLEILKAISPFVSGIVEFSYEEGYKFRIWFKKSGVFIQQEVYQEPIWDEPININTIRR